jgi:hypothetical protein
MYVSRQEKLREFVEWAGRHVPGDEKGEAQIFLDRLFIAFGRSGLLDAGGTPKLRIRKAKEDGGGTAFADYGCKAAALREARHLYIFPDHVDARSR